MTALTDRSVRVLVDAPAGSSALVESLRDEELAVLVAPAGGLLQQVDRGDVDLVLLHLDATEALAQLGELRQRSEVPVLVALRDARTPRERLLEAGADDCVDSAVSHRELAARVRAVARRGGPSEDVLRAGPVTLDVGRHTVLVHGRPLHLPPKEFGLLELLLRRDGRVVAREEALQLVWGEGRTGDPTTVDVHVKRLRAKLEADPARPAHLLTVRGLGYRYQV